MLTSFLSTWPSHLLTALPCTRDLSVQVWERDDLRLKEAPTADRLQVALLVEIIKKWDEQVRGREATEEAVRAQWQCVVKVRSKGERQREFEDRFREQYVRVCARAQEDAGACDAVERDNLCLQAVRQCVPRRSPEPRWVGGGARARRQSCCYQIRVCLTASKYGYA